MAPTSGGGAEFEGSFLLQSNFNPALWLLSAAPTCTVICPGLRSADSITLVLSTALPDKLDQRKRSEWRSIFETKTSCVVLSCGANVLLCFVSTVTKLWRMDGTAFFCRSLTCAAPPFKPCKPVKRDRVSCSLSATTFWATSTMRKTSLWRSVSFLATACVTLVGSTQASSTPSKVAAAWYAGWHADAGFPLSEVPWSKYTHLTYSFA